MTENNSDSISTLLRSDLVDAFNAESLLYRRVLKKPAVRNVILWQKTIKDTEDDNEASLLMVAYLKRMTKELADFKYGCIDTTEEDEPEEEKSIIKPYNLNPDTKTENRARFIAQNLVELEKPAADSTWIRGLLEGFEHKKFHRSMIARVLKILPAFLPVRVEIHGGKSRAVLPKSFFNSSQSPGPVRLGGG